MELRHLYKPIEKDLALVEALITKTLSQREDMRMNAMTAMLLQSKGKRLRPAFVLLSAYACSEKHAKKQKDAIIKTAAAFELIHMATLVHDDAMDSNASRHSRETINCRYGDASAIGMGDYLFSKAFVLLADTGDALIVGIASQAIATVCEGQMYQISRRGNLLSFEENMMIIKKKTAALFSAACESGAVIARGNTTASKMFGHHFGIAFQLLDDYLDIAGTQKMLGKQPGENLMQGEATIPLVLLLDTLDSRKKKALEPHMFTKEGVAMVKRYMAQHDTRGQVRKMVHTELGRATQALIGKNKYAQSLAGICTLLESRFSGQ